MRRKRSSLSKACAIGVSVGTLIGLLGWDVVAAIQADVLTPRQILYRALWHRPTLAFAVGLLAGHFFWPLQQRHRPLSIYIVSLAALASCLLWLEYLAYIPRPVWLMPAVPFLVGILAGHWLWTYEDPLDWRELPK